MSTKLALWPMPNCSKSRNSKSWPNLIRLTKERYLTSKTKLTGRCGFKFRIKYDFGTNWMYPSDCCWKMTMYLDVSWRRACLYFAKIWSSAFSIKWRDSNKEDFRSNRVFRFSRVLTKADIDSDRSYLYSIMH